MSTQAPFRVDDGNWKIAKTIKDGFRFPFFDRGDGRTFEYIRRQSFDRNFPPNQNVMDAVQTIGGIAYLVERGDWEDQGFGIYEQENVYTSIPATRSEGASINYTLQLKRATIGDAMDHGFFYNVNFELAELTFTCSAEIVYEYFASTRPQPILKPRLELVFEAMYSIGGLPPTSGRVAAEDSEVTLYKGRIYQRRTPYVTITPRKPVPTPPS